MWVTGVRHFETARLPRNVGHQLHSGVAPHFRRTETSLNVIIRKLHCHVGEIKNVQIFYQKFTRESIHNGNRSIGGCIIL